MLNMRSHSDRREAISLAIAYIGYVDCASSLDNSPLSLCDTKKELNSGTAFAWRDHMDALIS